MPNDAGALTLLCAESLDETQENTPKQLIYGRFENIKVQPRSLPGGLPRGSGATPVTTPLPFCDAVV